MQSSDGHRRRKARLCMSNQTRLQKTRSAESVPLQVGPVCSARPRGHASSAVHELGAAGGGGSGARQTQCTARLGTQF